MEYRFFFIFSSLQADPGSGFVRSRSFSQNTALATAPANFPTPPVASSSASLPRRPIHYQLLHTGRI
jgi:hypothetical protein